MGLKLLTCKRDKKDRLKILRKKLFKEEQSLVCPKGKPNFQNNVKKINVYI